MGFLEVHRGVEDWLRTSSVRFRNLSQKEYSGLVRNWRSRFEHLLVTDECLRGSSAEQAVECRLPCDGFVFSVPGYRLLPASTDARFDPAYAYEVGGLESLDFDVTNSADAIVVDRDLTFTFLGTHEAGALARPAFCELRPRV